jgi:predicted nucleic acid-binding protein
MITNPRATPQNEQCRQWLAALLASGVRVALPEIADYEVRRELLRARRLQGIARLDQAKTTLEYLPLTTEAMLQAADLWAHARQQGQPTAPDLTLDADVILAAQALLLAQQGEPVVIATTNVGHLARFVPAQLWQQIQPPVP